MNQSKSRFGHCLTLTAFVLGFYFFISLYDDSLASYSPIGRDLYTDESALLLGYFELERCRWQKEDTSPRVALITPKRGLAQTTILVTLGKLAPTLGSKMLNCLRDLPWLSKNILLVSDEEHLKTLKANNSQQLALLGDVTEELKVTVKNHSRPSRKICYRGLTGKLPNLDFVATAVHYTSLIPASLNEEKDASNRPKNLYWDIQRCNFLLAPRESIDAIEISFPADLASDRDLQIIISSLLAIIRSLSNLYERLHHSSTIYILNEKAKLFVSLENSLLCYTLILLPLVYQFCFIRNEKRVSVESSTKHLTMLATMTCISGHNLVLSKFSQESLLLYLSMGLMCSLLGNTRILKAYGIFQQIVALYLLFFIELPDAYLIALIYVPLATVLV